MSSMLAVDFYLHVICLSLLKRGHKYTYSLQISTVADLIESAHCKTPNTTYILFYHHLSHKLITLTQKDIAVRFKIIMLTLPV